MYGLALAVLVFLLKWLQWNLLVVDAALDVYIGLIALLFMVLGIWIATRLIKPGVEKVIVEKEVMISTEEDGNINEAELKRLNLSSREYEVLQLLAKGHRNAEIAQELYISVSTVKTHVSRLLEKLEVKSRTHAVTKAKALKLI